MTAQEAPDWQCVVRAQAEVGECPVWSAAQRALYWIDIYGPALYRSDPETGATQAWTLPEPIGCFALRDGGQTALVAIASGLGELDLASGALTPHHAAPYDRANYRFNDGRCDRQGRFWVGTTRLPGSSAPDGSSAFWRLDAGGLRQAVDGTTIANGIAFSPDGGVMYLADRPNWRILAFDIDIATGAASNRRVFATVPEGEIPDGAAVDAEGGYWIAMFRAGRILRFTPEGRLDRDLKAPCSMPTMIAFGGDHLATMYVTSARRYLDDAGRAREPHAGSVFRCDVGARGLAEPLCRF
jgi:sugar lactone lactonase YvrE